MQFILRDALFGIFESIGNYLKTFFSHIIKIGVRVSGITFLLAYANNLLWWAFDKNNFSGKLFHVELLSIFLFDYVINLVY